MGLFDELAGRSFSTSPTGERLFHLNGPWSRPYVIPDQATEERLRRKVRMLAKVIVLGPLTMLLGLLLFLLVIVVLAANLPRSHSPSHEDVSRAINPAQKTIVHKDPNLNIEIPESSPDRNAGGSALFVLVPLGLVLAAGVLLPKLLFGKDLRQLRRLPTRISFTDFYRPYAKSNSYAFLILGLLMFGSVTLLRTFGWMRRLWLQGIDLETFISLLFLCGLWFLSLVIGYQLFLKITNKRSGPQRAS